MRPYELGFLTGRDHEQRGWQHGALLRGVPPYREPAEHSRPVKVRVVKPFCFAGKRQEVDTLITLRRFDALSLAAAGRCVVIEE